VSKLKDITDEVSFDNPDDECLPLRRCACGKTFTSWDFIIGIYPDGAAVCPGCRRRLIFQQIIKVYEVSDE
jgi:hypothetical protein